MCEPHFSTSDYLWLIMILNFHYNLSFGEISEYALLIYNLMCNYKQLLDEVEHDIMNYQSRGLCYLPKPKAEADNSNTRV